MTPVLSFTFITANENGDFEVVIEYEPSLVEQVLGREHIEHYVQRAPLYVWEDKETSRRVSIVKDLEIQQLLEGTVDNEKVMDKMYAQLSKKPNRV